MRLIDADKMAVEESEAYLSAQCQIKDEMTRSVNAVVHTKIQQLIADTPDADAAEVLRDQWVSVEDRLPEEDEKCIFFARGNNAAHIGQYIYTGRDGAVKFKKRDGRGTVLYTASHWMPRPDPPEEGKP